MATQQQTIQIAFDSEREPTAKEVLLAQRMLKENDVQAALELIQLRAANPVSMSDLEALPYTQLIRIITDVSTSFNTAMILAQRTTLQ